jgi:putative hemolysin
MIKGKKGLYTTTLFKLKDELLDALNPAIELGRSFVRIEYQRKQATLSLLWKGIGSFVGRNPRYSRLFGPVSITAEYNSISKDLMVQFLKETKFHPTFSKLVRARNPHRTNRLRTFCTNR